MCDCSPYENKIYQVTIRVPSLSPFYAVISFLSKNLISSQENIAANLQGTTFSDITGYYECPNANYVLVSGTAYYSPDPTKSYLNNTGSIALFQYALNFSNGHTTCTGRSIVNHFAIGSNPYTLANKPTRTGKYATTTCQLFKGPKRG